MIELTTIPEHFGATVAGRRRSHVLIRTIGAPVPGDAVRIAEVLDGHYTGRVAFARVTYVETFTTGPLGPMHIVSLDVRMSSDRMPALSPTTGAAESA